MFSIWYSNCKMMKSLLWMNPWKYLKGGKEQLMLNVIISQMFWEIIWFKMLIFWQIHIRNLYITTLVTADIYEKSKISAIQNEILNLFINGNTKFTHLYVPYQFDYQLLIPGSEHCFKRLKFLHCNTSISDHVLTGLTEICKSIRQLELFTENFENNYGVVKLIETSKKII